MVRFLDVGQGDAALITSPAGASILVDGGPDEEQVATELAALGVKRLDLLVASHPHADHIVGLPAVLARIPTSLVLQPGCPDDSSIQGDLDGAIGDEAVPVRSPRAGDALTVGDVRIDVLSPGSVLGVHRVRREQRRVRAPRGPRRRGRAHRLRVRGARAGVAARRGRGSVTPTS